MRVFVTGATGFVGSVVLQDLIRARSHYRGPWGHGAAGVASSEAAPQSDMVRHHVTRAPGSLGQSGERGLKDFDAPPLAGVRVRRESGGS